MTPPHPPPHPHQHRSFSASLIEHRWRWSQCFYSFTSAIHFSERTPLLTPHPHPHPLTPTHPHPPLNGQAFPYAKPPQRWRCPICTRHLAPQQLARCELTRTCRRVDGPPVGWVGGVWCFLFLLRFGFGVFLQLFFLFSSGLAGF